MSTIATVEERHTRTGLIRIRTAGSLSTLTSMKISTSIAYSAVSLVVGFAAAAPAAAKTVRCGSPKPGVYNVVGKNIRPIPERLSGMKQGGCWVADWVGMTQFDNWMYGTHRWKHWMTVRPHDALVSERWHYMWRTRNNYPEPGDWAVYFTARNRGQVVTFRSSS